MIDNLKKISVHNRQKIIKIVGLDKRYEDILIQRYCNGMTRTDIADRLCVEPETVDKMISKARKQFNSILMNEIHLFSNEDRKYLDLLQMED